MRTIRMQSDSPRQRLEKTGPAAAAVKFAVRAEQRHPADRIDKSAGAFFIQMRTRKRAFGALFKGNPPLFRRQQLPTQPAPECGAITVVAGIARHLPSLFEQHDGRRGEQRLFQRPARRRLRTQTARNGHIGLPAGQNLCRKLSAKAALFRLENDQLPAGIQRCRIKRRRYRFRLCGSRGGHSRIGHPSAPQAAIAVGVFLQVILVLILRPRVIAERCDFRGDCRETGACQRPLVNLPGFKCNFLLGSIGVIDCAAVIAAPIVPLPVALGRVVVFPEMRQHSFQTDLPRVEPHLDHFGVVALLAQTSLEARFRRQHLTVGRIDAITAGVPALYVEHARQLRHTPFRAPETAHPENDAFHFLLLRHHISCRSRQQTTRQPEVSHQPDQTSHSALLLLNNQLSLVFEPTAE